MRDSSRTLLQHPRRSLGNRYRRQAEKFLKFAKTEENQKEKYLGWAEQTARQAILHDFGFEENWLVLAKVKLLRKDSSGLRVLLADLFSILGRDPERLEELERIDILSSGWDLLLACFEVDPLDPDSWWDMVTKTGANEGVIAFLERCHQLDFRDWRSTVIFGRRLERIRDGGYEDEFLTASHELLSHRPNNHELWVEVGKLHERREEWDEAWLCYDQAQTHRPDSTYRVDFRARINKLFSQTQADWVEPDKSMQSKFLTKLEELSQRHLPTPEPTLVEPRGDDHDSEDVWSRLEHLLESGEAQTAFFLARRLLTNGELEAREYLNRAKEMMDGE